MSAPITDPASVDIELDAKATELDQLGKDLDSAVKRLDDAEEAWDKVYDQVGEALKVEYIEAGRKSDPAEHTIKAAARREHRTVYIEYTRAKRNLERVQKRIGSTGQVVSARQSQAKGLRDEMRAGMYSR